MEGIVFKVTNFEGFYCSTLESIFDNSVNSYYNGNDELIEKYNDSEFLVKDFEKYKNHVSNAYADHIQELYDCLDSEVKIEFNSIESPKFYNYTTDSLYLDTCLSSENKHDIAILLQENKELFFDYLGQDSSKHIAQRTINNDYFVELDVLDYYDNVEDNKDLIFDYMINNVNLAIFTDFLIYRDCKEQSMSVVEILYYNYIEFYDITNMEDV
jgi:hypothetical protein